VLHADALAISLLFMDFTAFFDLAFVTLIVARKCEMSAEQVLTTLR